MGEGDIITLFFCIIVKKAETQALLHLNVLIQQAMTGGLRHFVQIKEVLY